MEEKLPQNSRSTDSYTLSVTLNAEGLKGWPKTPHLSPCVKINFQTVMFQLVKLWKVSWEGFIFNITKKSNQIKFFFYKAQNPNIIPLIRGRKNLWMEKKQTKPF